MFHCFHAADILIPQHISMTKWSCVACDQFSSQPEYWKRVDDFVGDAPSTLRLIYPEALLNEAEYDARIAAIHERMDEYLNAGIFRTFRRSFIYVNRRLPGGIVREGLVGQIDLEAYDYHPEAHAEIRATEATVQERIPPRMKLLDGAALEFPHVLLLCDDSRDVIMRTARQAGGEKIYDFDLMENGGHITGSVIQGIGVSLINAAIGNYISAVKENSGDFGSMSFAVGDGNHSLASAKACWEKLKPTLSKEESIYHPARFALVELENIHSDAITFEPIHRLLTGVNREHFIKALRSISASDGYPIRLLSCDYEETIYLPKEESPLAVAILQPFLDDYLRENGGSIDYIHGEEPLRQLASQPDSIGILLRGMDKSSLFPGVLQGGVLPRKTFSMGEANEKRYYLEGKMRR